MATSTSLPQTRRERGHNLGRQGYGVSQSVDVADLYFIHKPGVIVPYAVDTLTGCCNCTDYRRRSEASNGFDVEPCKHMEFLAECRAWWSKPRMSKAEQRLIRLANRARSAWVHYRAVCDDLSDNTPAMICSAAWYDVVLGGLCQMTGLSNDAAHMAVAHNWEPYTAANLSTGEGKRVIRAAWEQVGIDRAEVATA